MPMTAAVPTRHELPPGPSLPGAAQTLRWVVRPTAFMEECRRRYGDCFTLRIASEGSWVLVSDPESIKKVFTGNPEHLRAGEANAILRPVVGSESVLLLDGPSHLRQRKLLLPPRDEDGASMTDQELRDELMTLLVAGHETTATSLAWTLERVVRHPEVLARLEDEADSHDEDAFAYADAVAHEALRLRP